MSSKDNNDINVVLHSLTGRSEGYVNKELNVGSKPIATANSMVKQARDLLQLNRTDTDFYVVAPYVALTSSPEIRRMLPADTSTLLPHISQEIKNTIITGATPVVDEHGQPRFEHVSEEFPVASRWQVDYYTNDSVRITNDVFYRQVVPSRFVDGILYVEWPDSTGFRGGLKINNGVWGADINVLIDTPTRSYPFRKVRDLIKDQPSLIILMTNNGLIEPFVTAREPYQAVAALAAAIVKEAGK